LAFSGLRLKPRDAVIGNDMKRSILIAATLLGLGACANPCHDLADSACETAGEQSESCQRLQTLAGRSSTETQRSCRVALGLIEALDKTQ
jgi:hypothetical protein